MPQNLAGALRRRPTWFPSCPTERLPNLKPAARALANMTEVLADVLSPRLALDLLADPHRIEAWGTAICRTLKAYKGLNVKLSLRGSMQGAVQFGCKP